MIWESSELGGTAVGLGATHKCKQKGLLVPELMLNVTAKAQLV